MSLRVRTLCWIFLALALPGSLLGHAGINTRIADVTRRISSDPANALLYVKRGELHRLHRDWASANRDFDLALQLEPNLVTVHLSRGRMCLEAGRLETAKAELDRFLVHQPNHLEGLIARARVLVRQGNRLAAVKD